MQALLYKVSGHLPLRFRNKDRGLRAKFLLSKSVWQTSRMRQPLLQPSMPRIRQMRHLPDRSHGERVLLLRQKQRASNSRPRKTKLLGKHSFVRDPLLQGSALRPLLPQKVPWLSLRLWPYDPQEMPVRKYCSRSSVLRAESGSDLQARLRQEKDMP